MITLQAVQLPKPDPLYKKDMAVAKFFFLNLYKYQFSAQIEVRLVHILFSLL